MLALALGACASPAADDEPSDPPASPLGTTPFITGVQVPRQLEDLGDGTMLLSDQRGVIHVIVDGALRDSPLLDVTDLILLPRQNAAELGLAGFAVAPDFATSGVLYTYTTEPGDGGGRTDVLRRWQVDPVTLTWDGSPSTVVLEVPHDSTVHVGGDLVFDDEGQLYLGVGAPPNSPEPGDPTALPGSILRIIPTADGYTIPDDNPYAHGGGRAEIFALGYRNPFRLDWHPLIGLVVAEPMFREKDQQVGVAVAGADAGYPDITAVQHCWDGSTLADACAARPDGAPITAPVLEYDRSIGEIVSGALVIDDEQGTPFVLVTDWRGGALLAEPTDAPWPWVPTGEIDGPGGLLWAIDRDGAGTVYLMYTSSTMHSGSVQILTGLDDALER